MRILHIYKDFYPPTVGGIETHMYTLIQATRDYCDSIRVLISNRNWKNETVEVEGIEVHKVADLGRFMSAPLSPGFPLALRRYHVDILHYHAPIPTAEVAHLLARPPGRVIVSYHSDVVRQARSYRLYAPIQRRFLASADRIIATSPNYLASSPMLRRFADRCEVISPGIDLSHFERTEQVREASQRIAERYPGRRVLFVGRLCYYKGLSVLLSAMERVEGHLLVVGGGPMQTEYLKLHRTLPHRERVHFIGQVDSVVPYYYAADVFCLPSTHRSESFGIVQLEAGACGLPVVSTALDTGVPYVNRHGETGLIVPVGDSVALAEALNVLLADEATRRRMGESARRRVHAEFSARVMGDQVLDLYRRVLAGEARR
ncbi:glycosyltransferase [bacterium]|nr:glycosyltransferase [bacterium]